MLTHGDAAGRRGADSAAARDARSRSASRSASTRRRTGSCTARPICCRRSIVDRYGDYLVVQALSQGMDRLLPAVVDGAERSAAAARHPGAQRSARAAARRPRAARRRARPATCRTPVAVTETRHRVRRRSAARPEDRAVSRPAREPRGRGAATRAGGCSTASATTAASRWRWHAAATETIAFDISEDAVARVAAERRAERRRRRRARRQRVRRAARARAARRAVRHDRARPAGVREEQGGGRQGDAPATRRSTCAR